MNNINQKKLIINADDFGICVELNDSVLNGFKNGMLTQTSLIANSNAFDDAVKRVIPQCQKLAIGVHLNTFEGKALTICPKLTDKSGQFNKSFLQTLINSHNRSFLAQIEQEWEAQILKIINAGITPSHIDSHVHYHAIPALFKIAVKLAKKHNIPNIRTQYEQFYTAQFNTKIFINIIKHLVLKFFSVINKFSCEINTNDFLTGILYTSMMSTDNIIPALRKTPTNSLSEILIHPKKDSEYELLFDEKLKNFLREKNFILTNYKGENFENY